MNRPFLTTPPRLMPGAPVQIARAPDRIANHAFFWLFCAAILAVIHSGNHLDSDEGLVLNAAWNVFNGRQPYTDFFEFIAPGSFYAVAAWWHLVGPDYMAAKLLGVAAILGAASALYHIAKRIVEAAEVSAHPLLLWFGPLVFILYSGYWPTINHNTFHIVFVLWSVYFTVRYLERGKPAHAALAGALAGMAGLFLQHRGILVAAIALPVLLLLPQPRPFAARAAAGGAYLAGLALAVVPVFAVWPPSLLFEHLVVFPAQHYMDINHAPPRLLVVAAMACGVTFWGIRQVTVPSVRYLMLLQAGLLLASLQRPDFNHITMNLFPLLALVPLHGALAARGSRNAQRLAVVLCTALAALVLHSPVFSPGWFQAPFRGPAEHPALDFVRANCGGTGQIYSGPFLPGLHYEIRAMNPLRYSLLLENFNTPQQFAESARVLRSHPPRCAVTAYTLADKFGYTKNNEVDRFLFSDYQKKFEAGVLTVWVKRD